MTRARRSGRRLARARIVAAAVFVLATACSSTQQDKLDAQYGPSESVLEVVAVLRRHVPDDTYRFPPATDFTGRNVYRSTLLRLESLERVHADALRSGYLDGVVTFAKARALERLRGFDLAAAHYREAARLDPSLADEALASARTCEEIAEALAVGPELPDPLATAEEEAVPADATPAVSADAEQPVSADAEQPVSADAVAAAAPASPVDPEQLVALLDERAALLSFLLDAQVDTHYAAVIREEIERADVVRATWFERRRYELPDGQLRAVSELARVVSRHAASKHRLRHRLALAALYDDLAHEYVEAVPPPSLDFDPARFQDLVDPAVHLYESVAAEDGTPEKLEASRRLEAFLAFTLVVDRDRFTY